MLFIHPYSVQILNLLLPPSFTIHNPLAGPLHQHLLMARHLPSMSILRTPANHLPSLTIFLLAPAEDLAARLLLRAVSPQGQRLDLLREFDFIFQMHHHDVVVVSIRVVSGVDNCPIHRDLPLEILCLPQVVFPQEHLQIPWKEAARNHLRCWASPEAQRDHLPHSSLLL